MARPSKASRSDSDPSVVEEPLSLEASDGYRLAATRFRPAPGKDTQARVLIGAAMGVRQRFYASFARGLAAHGFEVITLDYRGIAGSAPPRLRGFAATATDWGKLDLAAALRWAFDEAPARPVLFVGHSVGGQVLPLADRADELAGVLLLCAQAGSVSHWSGRKRLMIEFFWRGVVPVTTSLFGRVPGWALGGDEDLPAGVARQWARWGTHPEYLLGEHPEARVRASRITAPALAVSFEDDFYAPQAAVDRLASWYGPSGAERLHLRPGDVGVSAVGHFGCFRSAHREGLWVRLIDFLSRSAAAAPRT
jgi:predicted alpha/beta hydrolase